MTKRRAFVYLLLLLRGGYVSAFNDDVHNRQLLQVLFGRLANERNVKTDDGKLFYPAGFSPAKKENILVLEKALYWCIDEYNGHHPQLNGYPRRYLADLKRFGIKNVPKYETINFTANEYHQRYTHRGWDWIDYPVNHNGYNFKEIWRLRKELLLSTMDKIFNFRQDEAIKRQSFGAVLYYAHILGDHAGDSKSTYTDRIPVSPRDDYRGNRSGENSFNPTIYTELLYHISRLFREQTNTIYYQMLTAYLERKKNTVFPAGTTISDEKYAELQAFSKATLDTLIEYIPPLLREENFFRRVFY